MGLHSRLPAVCSALGARRFCDEYRLERRRVDGPMNGATTTFVFKLL
jgi:hypothetical protein